MSLWWLEQLKQVPNQCCPLTFRMLCWSSTICRSLNMFPVECIVRGYLTGSGLAAYNETGEIVGEVACGLVDGSRLRPRIFTPTGGLRW